MVTYTFSGANPAQQYIQIKAVFPVTNDSTKIHLPSWRPGRYELANFAKNIKDFKVYSEENKRLDCLKINKDTWEVNTQGTKEIHVVYQYYATELTGGSTFLSKDQLYVNPVNCCVFTEETKMMPVELTLNIPASWDVACSMEKVKNVWQVQDFDELADSPFICSPSLQHQSYEVKGVKFHLWMNGEVKPDWDRMLTDFKAFTSKQMEKFLEFPAKEYHFIFQIVPYKAYHGVEHVKSTVILLGPSYDVFDGFYKELLGVSSHELYHAWNVKSIRPIEMFPYDFTKENYSRLGYICEGITTYMGDLFLWKSGVFNKDQYFLEFYSQLQKHFDNHARFHYSVGESSFDTWLDGYVPGAPRRKVSIYTEGCLIAFMVDVHIMRATNNKHGLDDVMRKLYVAYAQEGKGVSEADYKQELEFITGESFDVFFEKFVHGTEPFESELTECLTYLGLELIHTPSPKYSAGRLGFKTVPNGQNFNVKMMYPGSPGEMAGLMLEDEIVAVNGCLCAGELDKWLQYFDDDVKTITAMRSGRIVEVTLPTIDRNFYMEYSLGNVKIPSGLQLKSFDTWHS
jgi:predicted metalloprotease with PDZ domain